MSLSKLTRGIRKLSLTLTLSLIVSVSVLALSAKTQASTYGSGGYGDCTYGQGCSSSPSANSANSSGSTQSPSTNAGSSIILLNDFNDYFSSGGKQILLKQGQVICFDITSLQGTQRYCITVKQVGNNFVIFVIEPGSITGTLFVGDAKQYDVNGDKVHDIEVRLNGISANGEADITFKALSQAPHTSAQPQKPAPHRNWWWAAAFASLLLLGLIWWVALVVKRRKNKNKSDSGNL